MRVLWFCNTPAASDEAIGSNGTGGWLKSLDKELQKVVDLHIAFYSKTKSKPFKVGLTTYYPIPAKSNIYKFVNQYFPHSSDEDDLSCYLEIINKVKPDIIHIHGTELPFGCIVRHTNIPVVISIQGNLTVCNHKYFAGIGSKYLYARKFNSYHSLYIRGYIKNYNTIRYGSKTELKNLKYARNVIGRTDWDRRIMSVMANNAKYFHNDEMLRDEFYINSWYDPYSSTRPVTVHTTCGENYYKGFETICHAVEILNDIGVLIDWRVAGISDESLLNHIVKKQLKKSYPLKGLALLGQIDVKTLVDKMSEADMYVMASHIENSPNNLCEAMILGMPCISTFAGGSGSLLEDHKEWILVQDGDPWAMAGAILELARDRESANEYGKNARNRALIRHDKNRVVSSLVETYSSIISRL